LLTLAYFPLKIVGMCLLVHLSDHLVSTDFTSWINWLVFMKLVW